MLLWKEKRKYIDVTLLLKAELVIIKFVQKKEFSNNYELQDVVSKRRPKLKGPLSQFNPFIDEEGIVHVGGRIGHSLLEWKLKHPIIIPKESFNHVFVNSSFSSEDSAWWKRCNT